MPLNCREGDIARIVNCTIGNTNRLVRVVRPASPSDLEVGGVLLGVDHAWVVEALQPLHTWLGPMAGAGSLGLICDDRLRPIRDQPGEDEMLRIAGMPKPVKAPVALPA